MPSLVTRQGIEEAFKHLPLKKGTLKARLVEVLDSYFPDDEAIQQTKAIPVEELVTKIWNTGSPEEISSKRKNFSSLKSGLNQSLKGLDKKGKNPEGIILGRNNVFIVSEKRKDDILQKLGLSTETPQSLKEMFSAFKKVFSEIIKKEGVDEVKDLLKELDEARKVVQEISGLTPVEGEPAEPQPLTEDQQIVPNAKIADEPPAEPDSADNEDLEVVGEDEIEEIAASQDPDEIVEVEEVDEDELAEIEEPEALDELEEVEEAPEEEVLAADGDIEVVDEEDLEEAAEDEAVADSDIEVVDEDELEEIETPEALDDLEEVEEEPEEEVLAAGGDIEVVDEADLEEAAEEEAADDGDAEVVDEDQLEETETAEALDELEEVEEAPEEEVLAADDDIEVVDEADLEEAAEAEAADDSDIEVVDEDQLEEVEAPGEAEEIGEVLEDELSEADSDVTDAGELEEVPEEEVLAADDDIETVDEEDIEEVVEEEFLDDSEIEVIDEDELGVGTASGEPGDGEAAAGPHGAGSGELMDGAEKTGASDATSSSPSHPRSPLAVLSKYLDPEEALIDESQLLHESDEEYAAQILDRFKPKFIKIPGGTYLIGSSHPKPLEQPQREVTLEPFYLGQLPVTNDLFDLFVRDTGYVTDAEQAGYGVVFEGRCVTRTDPATGRATLTLSHGTSAQQVQGANWRHPAGPGSGLENKHNHPAVQVSRNDAIAFATWAGKKLPTEEEWEAAARGQDGGLFPWGDNWLPDLANLGSSCNGDTTPVERHGRPSLSPFGLYDMVGNVYEWTASVYRSPYGKENANGIKFYVLKGGCWASNGVIAASHRLIERENYWSNTIGFRCAV